MNDGVQSTRVLVTGVGGGAVGHQVLHALQRMGGKYEITAVDADAYSFGLYQVKSRFVVPLAADPDYVPALRSIIARNNIQVVIPGTEAELKVMAARRKELEGGGCLVLVNPLPVVEICANKLTLAHWLKTHGFDTPESVPATEWRSLVERKGFPVVAKPAASSSGSRNVVILNGEKEVLRYLETLSTSDSLIQEYVGSAQDEYTVGVCVGRDSRVIDSIVLKRRLTGMTLGLSRVINERSFTLSTGYSQGFVIVQPLIQDVCERLAAEIGICGPANIQCRLAEDRVMIFEVHPRFSGTTSLRADVGFNEPDVLIRALLHGEKVEKQTYATDVAVIRAFQSVVVPLREMQAVPRVP